MFLQSQSEDFGEFDGLVDTEMSYDEFIEALLRIGVGMRPCHGSFAALREAFLPMAVAVGGELEGGETKLSWYRLQELIKQEEARLEKTRVSLMWAQFGNADGLLPSGAAAEKAKLDPEAIFLRMLKELEKEGNRGLPGGGTGRKKLSLLGALSAGVAAEKG